MLKHYDEAVIDAINHGDHPLSFWGKVCFKAHMAFCKKCQKSAQKIQDGERIVAKIRDALKPHDYMYSASGKKTEETSNARS